MKNSAQRNETCTATKNADIFHITNRKTHLAWLDRGLKSRAQAGSPSRSQRRCKRRDLARSRRWTSRRAKRWLYSGLLRRLHRRRSSRLFGGCLSGLKRWFLTGSLRRPATWSPARCSSRDKSWNVSRRLGGLLCG